MTELVRLGPIGMVGLADVHRDLLDPPRHEARPHLALNFVLTADGRASYRGRAEIGTRTDRELMRHLRRLADAALCGARTLDVDPFAPLLKTERSIALVVSRSAQVAPANAFFRLAGPRVVATVAEADVARVAALQAAGAEVVRLGSGTVDLVALAGWLASRGVRFALCEGGPHLAAALLAARLVDEIFLTHATLLTAEDAARRLFEGQPDFAGARVERVALLEGPAGERYERLRVAYSPE